MATTLYSNNNDFFNIENFTESSELELKLAEGKDGQGALPKSFWESYSAMANTDGGTIVLGVEENKDETVNIHGVKNHDKVLKDLWNAINNKEKVSVNLLNNNDIKIRHHHTPQDAPLIIVDIRPATREEKPVHIGSNPMTGTYIRRHDGDYKASEETVRRMLAERVENTRDERVLPNFSLEDLDLETVQAYRNRFSAVKPGHVYLDLELKPFLEKIGAYGKNRETGEEGLRIAGLLMFGRAETIREIFPFYMVDYQERPEAKAERRWVDRVAPDGTWSGNIYDFFRKTYQKLTSNTKTPFRLVDGQRVEDNAESEALREALVNTLIHADFTGRVSILIVKRPDMYGFRNPGKMRIPLELAIHGGNSDCRNRRLQTMFQLVGYGDHAGSGIPKIFHNWQSNQWRRPLLRELNEPEQTLMELRMESLFPQDASDNLLAKYGEKFTEQPELERLILLAAATEGTINHARIKELCDNHSADISRALTSLVRENLLLSDGIRRGMIYFLPGYNPSQLDDLPFAEKAAHPPKRASQIEGSCEKATDPVIKTEDERFSRHNEVASGHNEVASGHNEVASGHNGSEALAEAPQLIELLEQKLTQMLNGSALPRRVKPAQMQALILELCASYFVPLQALAQVLGRSEASLRKHLINPMVEAGSLKRLHAVPSHPNQAYMSNRIQASIDEEIHN